MRDFKIKNITDRKITKVTDKTITFSLFDIFGLSYKSSECKILILSSGLPIHNDLEKFVDFENFCDTGKNTEDKTGMSVLIASSLKGSESKSIVGFCGKSELYFAKVVSDTGGVSISSMIAAVMWGIIKEVDVIMIPFQIEQYDSILNDAIKKANDSGIIVVGVNSKGKGSNNIMYDNLLRFKYEEGKKEAWELSQQKNVIYITASKKYEPFSLFSGSNLARMTDDETSAVFGTALALYSIGICENRDMAINYKNVFSMMPVVD